MVSVKSVGKKEAGRFFIRPAIDIFYPNVTATIGM